MFIVHCTEIIRACYFNGRYDPNTIANPRTDVLVALCRDNQSMLF